VAIPLGSSSDAPVTTPGPKIRNNRNFDERRIGANAVTGSQQEQAAREADSSEGLTAAAFDRAPGRSSDSERSGD
jgi:hypothetical protein